MINRVDVVYEAEGIDSKFDDEIEAKMEELGFICWASGYNLIDKERDLAFTPRPKAEGNKV